jgi:ribonucleoside-diphosphate reductase alpha chain
MGYRWLNKLSQDFLEKDYLLPGQTVDERVNIICNHAENILKLPGFAAKLKANFEKGWYSFSTPIWTNFGTDRGLAISCFGSYIEDTMESIAGTWAEVCMMTKLGGGTSAYFGDLRPRGAEIKNNGKSSGSVNFMEAFDTLINIASQGSSRRGNCAVYLPVDHKDIEEFLQIRQEGHPIQDLSFGVCIPEGWMQSMIDGDQSKRKIWARILECRSNMGYPYIFFSDNVSNGTVDCYKNTDRKITHSNLCCVTKDQRVVSDRGLLTVEELYNIGGELKLFDGINQVSASPMLKISDSEDIFKITLDNGLTHKVTSEHRIETNKGMVKLKDLKIRDKVAIQLNTGIFGNKSMEDEAFLLGTYQANGTQNKDNIYLDLWEHSFDLIEEIETRFSNVFYKYSCDKYDITNQYNSTFQRSIDPTKFYDCVVTDSPIKKKRLGSNCLKKALNFEKGYIPNWIWESDEKTQWQYIRGLFYADGTISMTNDKGSPIYLSISNINKAFLEELQILLLNLGARFALSLGNPAGERSLPNGKGGYSLYNCQDCYRLVCGSKVAALLFEKNIQFLTRKGIELENRVYRDNTKKFSRIKSIEHIGQDSVYCCEVYTNDHKWVCNGIITHNSEILLPDNAEESFVCDLSSMNMIYYDEWKDTDAIELLVYLLDAVMTDFIEKAKKIKFMERAVRFAENHRALGIGWFGWHSLLQSKMIAFESMEAKYLNIEIAKNMKEKAYGASAKMAEEYGECKMTKGYGRRHVTLSAIAPTKSSSFIIEQASEAVEPDTANITVKDLAKGKVTIKNKYLIKILETKGKNTEKVWSSILKMGGSVQHLDFLTNEEKAVFKTFGEISPREIIIQAAQRQKYIDQSQSINLMIHPSVPTKDVNALLIEAWQMGVKTLYYQKSVNASQEFAKNILNCSSCEG